MFVQHVQNILPVHLVQPVQMIANALLIIIWEAQTTHVNHAQNTVHANTTAVKHMKPPLATVVIKKFQTQNPKLLHVNLVLIRILYLTKTFANAWQVIMDQ